MKVEKLTRVLQCALTATRGKTGQLETGRALRLDHEEAVGYHSTKWPSLEIRFLLYKVAILHPEDPLAAAMCHQLVPQVLWPVRPLVRPAAVPRKATPGVTQPQQPDARANGDRQEGESNTRSSVSVDVSPSVHYAPLCRLIFLPLWTISSLWTHFIVLLPWYSKSQEMRW